MSIETNLLPHILVYCLSSEVVREECVLAGSETLHGDVEHIASLNFVFANDTRIRASLHTIPIAVHRGRRIHVGLKKLMRV